MGEDTFRPFPREKMGQCAPRRFYSAPLVLAVLLSCSIPLPSISSVSVQAGGCAGRGGLPVKDLGGLILYRVVKAWHVHEDDHSAVWTTLKKALLQKRSRLLGHGLVLRGGSGIGAAMEIDTTEAGVGSDSGCQTEGIRNVVVKWKSTNFPVTMDVGKPAGVLKSTLYELTGVEPDRQFLLGIYKQGQDVNLASTGIKDGQNFVLLGEAIRKGPEVPDTRTVIPDDAQRGFFSMARMKKEELDALNPRLNRIKAKQVKISKADAERGGEMMDDAARAAPGSDDSEDESGPNKLRIQSIEETLQIERDTRDRAVNADAVTVPTEFRPKLGNLTTEEGHRLRQWIDETREWRIQTKIDKAFEARVNTSMYRHEHLRKLQRWMDERSDREEKGLNKYGLSRYKSYMIAAKYKNIVHKTDFLYNETTYQSLKPFLIGGMNADDSARFIEDLDEMDSVYRDLDRKRCRDAVAQERYERMTEDENHRRAIEESAEPSTPDIRPDEEWQQWVDFLKEHPGYPQFKVEMAKPLKEVPKNHPCYDELVEIRVNPLEAIERSLKKGELRDWVNFGWPDQHSLPNGLLNIGNTCYMASAMQMLRAVPELMSAIKNWKRSGRGTDIGDNLIEAAQLLLKDVAGKDHAPSPHTFMHHLRQVLPQFAQVGPMGPQQQDAEEALSGMLHAFSQKLKTPTGSNLIRELFEIELETQTYCFESMDEEPTYDTQRLLRLPLPIDKSTKTLHDALQQALEGTLEKFSPTLNRTAHYNTTMEISRLPPYILMQYMRFYWRTDTNKKAKICKNVHFPLVIDLLEYLSEELKTPIQLKLTKRQAKFFKSKTSYHTQDVDEMPRKFAEWDKIQVETDLMVRMGFLNATEEVEVNEEESTHSSDVRRRNASATEWAEARGKWVEHVGKEEEEEEEAIEKDKDLAQRDVDASLLGTSNITNSAIYQLRAIVAHQSRFAEAGHYIAYVRTGVRQSSSWKKAPEPMWLKFDDDQVSMVTENEVRNTAGGADNPISYVCLYGRSEAVAEGLSTTQY